MMRPFVVATILGLILAGAVAPRAAASARGAPSGTPAAQAPRADSAAEAASLAAISGALARWFAIPATPRREIEPHVRHPHDVTRSIEFRGAVPNPFRSETAIRFAIPQAAHVAVRVFDVSGRLVRTLIDAPLPPGDHSAMLSADGLAPGTYFIQLRSGGVQATRRVVRIR